MPADAQCHGVRPSPVAFCKRRWAELGSAPVPGVVRGVDNAWHGPHAPGMARQLSAQYPAMIDAPVTAAGDSESPRCEHGPLAVRLRETEPMAQVFGRGLHSRQDSSAHRSWSGGGDWKSWIAHLGWWDAWDDDDLRDIYGGFLPKYPSEEFWRNWHAHNPSQTDYDTFIGFAAWPSSQQEASQIAARQKVVTQSHEAIAQFVTAVRKTCFCRKEMLFRP